MFLDFPCFLRHLLHMGRIGEIVHDVVDLVFYDFQFFIVVHYGIDQTVVFVHGVIFWPRSDTSWRYRNI